MSTEKTNIQNTSEYKTMTPFLATSIAEGFCGGEDATAEEQKAAWQYLHDTGLAYQLQGWFGRTASDLIDNGIIHQ
jgi:geranylgeranyl pyrophosphate synthase